YNLAFPDKYNDVMATIVYTSGDVPFGAQLRNLYTDTVGVRTLHSSVSVMKIETNADGSLNFKGWDDTDFIANFKRKAHSSTLDKVVDEPLDYDVTPLE